jgi:aminoglycoside phosphotransferase (APT) family kinase protein
MNVTTMLDDDIVSWIEQVTGMPLAGANRIPGGGTRQGWFVDLRAPDGSTVERFLRYSPESESSAFHPLAAEAEVMRALGAAGTTVPAVHAVHPAREAVLLDRVAGDTWFYRIKDPAEQVRVAQDFIRSLAYVHRIDPAALAIPSLGPVHPAKQHALERLEAIRRRATGPDGAIDPLVRLSVDWLERSVPDYDGPVVLVQGDTGPGNFLYRDGAVTAVLDWELAHWGDPMDDIAWLSLRAVQDTFTHLPDRLAEYAELSGHPIDAGRIWYYRVFAETTMATLRPPRSRPREKGGTPTQDVGNQLLYGQLHRRLWLEALNEVMGLGLRRPEPPGAVQPEPWHHLYEDALGMLAAVTPRIGDPLAAQWTKGVARILRYLEAADAAGRTCAARERDEIAAALGARPDSVAAGRAALAEASRNGSITDDDYIRHVWNQVMRDDFLMKSASGALHERTWPPLT